ncbi:unnamed protein product [Rhizophagus irregularis]|nr:unnamed protein product [Rhizophagus irregularis]
MSNNFEIKVTENSDERLKRQYEMDFHENIIRFCGITIIENQDDDSKNYWLVMEYADNGLREKPVANTPIDYVKIYIDCWNHEPDNRSIISDVIAKLNVIILNKLSSKQPLNNSLHELI